MKLFQTIQHLVQKKPNVEPEMFLSVILDESYVQVGAWTLDHDHKPKILAKASERAAAPSWEDRIRMVDHAIGKLEEETGSAKLSKVVLGLGERFLTRSGDIDRSVRPHLKKLTQTLELSALGFVPLATGIAHFLRKSEGIPTSVILVGVTEQSFDISIYRVGRLAFSVSVNRTESEGLDIENGLKLCPDAEVLPSRILLYGADDVRIHEVQSVLLKYQWTSRANFLHYPKIEVYPFEDLTDSVVEAGANELTQGMSEDRVEGEGAEPESEIAAQKSESEPEPDDDKEPPLDEEPVIKDPEDTGQSHVVVVQPEALGFHESVGDGKEDRRQEEAVYGEEAPVENPLEFSKEEKQNLLHGKKTHSEDEDELMDEQSVDTQHKTGLPIQRSAGAFLHSIARMTGRTPKVPVIIGVVVLLLLGGGSVFALTYLPSAKITLSVLPKMITRNETIRIDPEAGSIDPTTKTVPGKKVEKVVSGEKTITATGKKKVGDPAKGTITLFNKSETTAYTLKKGTVVTTGSLQFTLDTDVSIASASTSLSGDQLTFGKNTAPVTAVAVGTEGNIASGRDFVVKDYTTSTLSGRNEKAFTGGTSREVTVVSRSDYDTLQKTLTTDLIEKAKAELMQSVSGKERMIDETIKTAVKEKKFTQEIDQEAKDLHGSLTVSVSAITYDESDIKSVLAGVAQSDVPAGYSVNDARTTVTVGEVTIAKDTSMSAKASLTTVAVPSIATDTVRKSVAGKKLTEAESQLRSLPGVASAEFTFQSAWNKSVLPKQADHISISVVTVE